MLNRQDDRTLAQKPKPQDDRTLAQKLMPIGIATIVLGVAYFEAPRQWERYQLRQSEVTRVSELQRSNQLLQEERAVADARYQAGCLLLFENGAIAQIVPNSKVVSGTNGFPLQPGTLVCDGIGGTGVVGDDGTVQQYAGNASPEVVRKYIEAMMQQGITAPVSQTTPAEG